MSKELGLKTTHDHIHFNENGGKILEELVKNFIEK